MSCSTEDESKDQMIYKRYIQGSINSKIESYPQVDLDGVNTSNTFFSKSKETWLQAYENNLHISKDGHWVIRIHDLDILSISLPYSNWEKASANISWDDNLTTEDTRCVGVDAGCDFIASTDDDLNFIITEVSNHFITGEFSGRFSLTGTGFGGFRDKSEFVDVENGSFKIKFEITD